METHALIYRRALRPILFTRDPEKAHELVIDMLATAGTMGLHPFRRPFTHSRLRTELAGVSFPNPVGLAAGCDKDGRAIRAWPHFGFGFVEIGTVTAEPQAGNPKPRVFRFPSEGALINRLGFNSIGSEAVARGLARIRRQRARLPVPIGINIGKTRIVKTDDAVVEDYRTSLRRLARHADFLVVNISSPNTPGLREWQERDHMSRLLAALTAENASMAAKREAAPPPLFVKVSPDMTEGELEGVAEVAMETGVAGIIATNTTVAREGAWSDVDQAGGLSGKPLKELALATLRTLYRLTQGRIPLIGVGGIATAEDAYARIRAGASLIEIYTALVYEGPYLPLEINRGLLKLMDRDGVSSISELVGAENR
jgi:dihydroorotate dehydrogenase